MATAADAAFEVDTVVGVVRFEDGKDFFPVILFLGFIKCCEDKHEHLRTHTDTQQGVAARQVENLE